MNKEIEKTSKFIKAIVIVMMKLVKPGMGKYSTYRKVQRINGENF